MICAHATPLTDLEAAIALVPDFPKPGILFRDMAPNTSCWRARPTSRPPSLPC